jgi:hypothetical protein
MTTTKKIPVNGARFMFWALASRAPSWPTYCFSSVSLRSPRQAEFASGIPDENFQEKTMSNDRYYVVGDCDMWCIQYAFAELAECTSRSKVIAFAIGAAQRLGMRGERAMYACSIVPATTVQMDLQPPSVGVKRLTIS